MGYPTVRPSRPHPSGRSPTARRPPPLELATSRWRDVAALAPDPTSDERASHDMAWLSWGTLSPEFPETLLLGSELPVEISMPHEAAEWARAHRYRRRRLPADRHIHARISLEELVPSPPRREDAIWGQSATDQELIDVLIAHPPPPSARLDAAIRSRRVVTRGGEGTTADPIHWWRSRTEEKADPSPPRASSPSTLPRRPSLRRFPAPWEARLR